MTDQEKLTDLIREAHKECKAQNDCHVCEVYGNGSDCVYMLIANRLIANGVKIPVMCKDCESWDVDPDTYGDGNGPRGKCNGICDSCCDTAHDDFCSCGEKMDK